MSCQMKFRPIDLLVAFLVILFLSVLLISAIPLARETARKWQCANNMRQLGVSLHAYHDAHGVLPPAAIQPNYKAKWILHAPKAAYGESAVVSHANWATLLLPYLGEEDLANAFDMNLPISAPNNAKARETELPLMNCPVDTYNRPDNHYLCTLKDGTKITYARGNYAINAGPSPIYNYPGNTSDPQPDGIIRIREGNMEKWWGSGVAGFNKSFAFEDFTNNLSTTVAIDEIRAGIAPADSRGAWALGQIGPSVTHAHGLYGDAVQPNCSWWRSDDILGCSELYDTLGRSKLEEERMGCFPDSYIPIQATARSMHPGGVNVLMMDGAVYFVVDDIDPNIWHAIHARKSTIPVSNETLGLSTAQEVTYTTTYVNANYVSNEGPTGLEKQANKSVRIREPEYIKNSIGMKLVHIPAGEFIMGLPDKGTGGVLEAPAHWVHITKPFYFGIYEVTQQQYQKVMKSNPSWHSPEGNGKKKFSGKDTSSFPVEQVSWHDAAEFCRHLSALPEEKAAGRHYQLPTEAQWEYVCRSGSTKPYDFSRKRKPNDDSGENGGGYQTKPKQNPLPIASVGTYKPNKFGVYDMRGNVWEWTADWYERSYYKRSPREDPQGPSSGMLRVTRGIDWFFTGQPCMLNLHTFAPSATSRFIGFRVVCEVEPAYK